MVCCVSDRRQQPKSTRENTSGTANVSTIVQLRRAFSPPIRKLWHQSHTVFTELQHQTRTCKREWLTKSNLCGALRYVDGRICVCVPCAYLACPQVDRKSFEHGSWRRRVSIDACTWLALMSWMIRACPHIATCSPPPPLFFLLCSPVCRKGNERDPHGDGCG